MKKAYLYCEVGDQDLFVFFWLINTMPTLLLDPYILPFN